VVLHIVYLCRLRGGSDCTGAGTPDRPDRDLLSIDAPPVTDESCCQRTHQPWVDRQVIRSGCVLFIGLIRQTVASWRCAGIVWSIANPEVMLTAGLQRSARLRADARWGAARLRQCC